MGVRLSTASVVRWMILRWDRLRSHSWPTGPAHVARSLGEATICSTVLVLSLTLNLFALTRVEIMLGRPLAPTTLLRLPWLSSLDLMVPPSDGY